MCSWLWVGDIRCLLWDYLCLLCPYNTSCLCHSPQYQNRLFYSCQNIIWRTITKSLKFLCRFKNWMEFVGQVFIKLEMSSNWCFLQFSLWCPLGSDLYKHPGGRSVTSDACISLSGGHSVTTEACTSPSKVCVVWRSGRSLELSALWWQNVSF